MRLTMTLTIACLFVLCLAGLAWERPARADRLVEQPNFTSTVRARAIVSGPNGISGEVLFLQGPYPGLIVSSTGRGFLSHITSRITLSPGPLSIFDADGSAVILHLNPDRGQPGVTGASGGARIACGVIQLVSDDDDSFTIGR